MPLVIAHRGASAEEVENSLAAFGRAVLEQADGVELDVHVTADGELVVVHDDVVGGQPIVSLPLREVRRHRLANGEAIPTLTEALGAIGPAIAFIEVKAMSPRQDERLLSVLAASPAPARCHVHSFDHRVIRRLRSRAPELALGVLSTSYLVQPLSQLAETGANELWQEHGLIDRDLVESLHGAEHKIYAWTVDEPTRLRALAALGVDGICTNHPARARSVLR